MMRWIALLAMMAVLLLVFAPVAIAANEPLLAPRADKPLPPLSVRRALPPPHPETIYAFATMTARRLAPEEFGMHLRRITTKNSEVSAASAALARKDVLKLPPAGPQRTPRRPMPPVVGTPTSLAERAAAAQTQPVTGCTSAGCRIHGSWQGIFRRRGD